MNKYILKNVMMELLERKCKVLLPQRRFLSRRFGCHEVAKVRERKGLGPLVNGM
jgi:hypothetical protein